jgi:hypothetical protein
VLINCFSFVCSNVPIRDMAPSGGREDSNSYKDAHESQFRSRTKLPDIVKNRLKSKLQTLGGPKYQDTSKDLTLLPPEGMSVSTTGSSPREWAFVQGKMKLWFCIVSDRLSGLRIWFCVLCSMVITINHCDNQQHGVESCRADNCSAGQEILQRFMESKVTLSLSQNLAIKSYPKPVKSNHHSCTLFPSRPF